MSAKRRPTRRRDSDPVRVYADGRLAYWTGGTPGQGTREWERHGTQSNAEVRAAELRDEFDRRPVLVGPKSGRTLTELVQDMLDTMRAEKRPGGTIAVYKSNWNKHIADELGAVRCREAALWHYTATLRALARVDASESVVKNVARTLGAIRKFGFRHGYFLDENTFGAGQHRRDLVADYRRLARIVQADQDGRVSLDICPSVDDVAVFAEAFEVEYPGYGARLVWLGFATGLRICELLALRWDSIDLVSMTVAVDWQLDRHRPWPAVKPPKSGKPRETRLWRAYAEVAASLVADALDRDGEEHGWLFPRHRSVKAWADQAGHLATAARKRCDWQWTGTQWLRHAYASWNLAPKEEGGYGVHPARVQKRLGHKDLSTTLNTYVHGARELPDTSDDDLRPPGRRAA